jgi:hypothetical protein
MPIENPDPTPPEQPHDDWQQLARDAAEQQGHWDLEHPGVAALYENHVVPQLYSKGLGHLAIDTAERAGSSSPNREDDAQKPESEPTKITVEQAGGGPTNIKVVSGVGARQLGSERTATSSDSPNRVVDLKVAPEDAAQQQESERKKNTTENLRVLQKRFGERFVKGNLMEGGGYTGGAARELLAGFMDRPGFADELKRLIPGKHGALQLLKDNHAYIQATLEQLYKDDPNHERAPAKDPYETARSVGYELTGPFTSTSEFVPYDKLDFPPGKLGQERLCTFSNPGERLRDYHILWLRRNEVADILPADKLTADNLNDVWKTYLKTIGRYNQESDSYDLAGLRPTRDDPYGTSSMSVQISRSGTHVSIKNRYNHTVSSPDNTLDSDLDHVAYGLKRAVYSSVGREDLMDKTSVALAEGYCADNDDGIHHYEYEEDNVYYGDYEYISNGVVTTIDRGKYYMISPQLYVPRSGKGDEINLRPKRAEGAELAVGTDVRFLYKNSSNSKEKDLRLTELRQAYAERDHGELTRALYEALMEQAASSHQGYAEIARATGAEVVSEQEFSQLCDAKMAEWHQSGVMDYLVRDFVENGNKPNLLATPNVVADWQTLRAIAVQFGEGQPYETYIYEDLYSQYSAEELSGQPTEGHLRLSIMPSGYIKQLGYEPVETQLAALRQLQAEQPALKARVPSVLEAITYWQTLRARGNKVQGNGTFEKTYIRHIDLEPKRIVSWSDVPYSYVRDRGGPYLYRSNAESGGDARVLVG